MRSVEDCIHEPFGKVSCLHSGTGSKNVAEVIVQSIDPGNWGTLGNKLAKIGDKERIVGVKDAPDVVVGHVNTRAMSVLRGESDHLTRTHLQTEMLVMGRLWSDQLDCLVHKSDIRKMLGASDTEHMLCMVSTLHVPEHSPQQEHGNEKPLGQSQVLSHHGTRRIHLNSHEVLLPQHTREIVCI